MLSVSVLIPCRNERHHIQTCLKGIFSQETPGISLEVIVADGMSDDGTRDILKDLCKRYPALMVVDNPAKITPAGLNAAIRLAKGSILVRMDAHTGYAPDYLRQCVAVLKETCADNVGGPWVARGQGLLSEAIAAAFQSPFSAGGARGHRTAYTGLVDTVYLGCWPRETFIRFGLFDEELVRNQDDEHNLRITRGGGRVWQSPRIRSWYSPRGSLSALFRQYFQYGYWKVKVIRKHRLPASFRHLVPALFVAGLAVFAAAAPFVEWIRWAGAATLGCYAVGLAAASVMAAARKGWLLLPVLPPVFAAFHIGYGFGFLLGMLDFIVIKRAPRARSTALTRA